MELLGGVPCVGSSLDIDLGMCAKDIVSLLKNDVKVQREAMEEMENGPTSKGWQGEHGLGGPPPRPNTTRVDYPDPVKEQGIGA